MPATVGVIPGAPHLLHVPAAEEGTLLAQAAVKEAGTKESHDSMFFIGAGLPSVPWKLVNRIQTGEFVDMAELLPDRISVSASPLFASEKEERPSQRSKRCQVSTITEWVQCFSKRSGYPCLLKLGSIQQV